MRQMAMASFNALEGKYSATYRTDALIRQILSCTNECFISDLLCIEEGERGEAIQ